jgi:hypothetical protein
MSKRSLITVAILLAISFVLASQTNLAQALPLVITVNSDKSAYNVGETAYISGTLIYYSIPVPRALVALQINDRVGPHVLRTLHTGTPPSGPLRVEVTNAYIGDFQGNPLSNVEPGDICYIRIYYQNNYTDDLDVTIAFTIYSASQVALFAQIPVSQSVPPGMDYYVSYAWQVPTDAESGTAMLYASAFTAPPQYGGIPYCTEKSYAFNVVSATSIPEQPMQTPGSFNSSVYFRKKNARIGNYTVYVAAFHLGSIATKSTTFQLILVGDVNGDKYVNAKDATLMGKAFNSKPGSTNWDSRADINGDGFVNAKDAVILGSNFGNSAI